MTGLPAGEKLTIRDDAGEALFNYRSFASVVPLVALVVAIVVATSGLAAVGFLVAEGRPVTAIIAAVLTAAFSVLIAMLVPATNVTINNDNNPALLIVQESNVSFPFVIYAIATPERKVLARFRRSVFSRLGRNRWVILPHDGEAIEETLGRAWMRKFAGKFSPRYESNVIVHYRDKDVAWIIRRPNTEGESDLLEITGTIDHRVAVGLAVLILGSEP